MLLGGLHPGVPRAHQRLVDVEVEQPDLGVGDPGDRLAVHADQLQQRDEREAGFEHAGDVAQQLQLVGAHPVGRRRAEPETAQHPHDERLVETGLRRGELERDPLLLEREQLLQESVGEPPVPGRAGELLERVTARPHARDDAGLADRGGGPFAPVLGDQPAALPGA